MADRTPKRPRDTNQLAKAIVDIAAGEANAASQVEEENVAAVTRGKLGGDARATSLTSLQRSEISRIAATVRWKKTD